MAKTWMILALVAVVVSLAAFTKSWWFPQGLRDRWNEAWITYPASEDPRAALLAGHARRMAALEGQFREKIEKEKATHNRLLADQAKLSRPPKTP